MPAPRSRARQIPPAVAALPPTAGDAVVARALLELPEPAPHPVGAADPSVFFESSAAAPTDASPPPETTDRALPIAALCRTMTLNKHFPAVRPRPVLVPPPLPLPHSPMREFTPTEHLEAARNLHRVVRTSVSDAATVSPVVPNE